jgi:hypothetical protein
MAIVDQDDREKTGDFSILLRAPRLLLPRFAVTLSMTRRAMSGVQKVGG